MLVRKKRGVGRPPELKTTTIRDFLGGWNVVDNELSMTPKFARIMENVQRGIDGSVAVRYGYRLYADFMRGVEAVVANNVAINLQSFISTSRLRITLLGHGLANNNHLYISGVGAQTIGGLSMATYLEGRTFPITVIDANNVEIQIYGDFSANESAAKTMSIRSDTHIVGYNSIIVDGVEFQDKFVLVVNTGEVISLDTTLTASIIWSPYIASTLSGAPRGWRATEFVTFAPMGGSLHIWSLDNKPLEVDFTNSPAVQYLGDPASGGSNAAVPLAGIGYAFGGYMFAAEKQNEPNELGISAKLSPGVWTGNPAPDDAVDVDMSKVSNASNTKITGLTDIRGKLVVAFKDSISIGTLGLYKTIGSAEVHEPDFRDSIPQHGAISHRTIIPLGNDVFLCDRMGVPSLSQSQVSGQFVPSRVSNLIEPHLMASIARLSDYASTYKTWAVYNPRERQYMLFMPKYDYTISRRAGRDPITVLGTNRFILKLSGHGIEEGDTLAISGVTAIGGNAAALWNNDVAGSYTGGTPRHTVIGVIDRDNLLLESSSTFTELDITGGGTNIMVRGYRNNESTCYVYTYNPELKIRSWSRFTGLPFTYGFRTVQGRLFLGVRGKLYLWGTESDPIHADKVGDYNYFQWVAGTSYVAGDYVRDPSDGTVWQAQSDHVAAGASFLIARGENPDLWVEFEGLPIRFVWEWPWGDFDRRVYTKEIMSVQPDVIGSGRYTMNLFADLLYADRSTGIRTPERSLEFMGADAGAYGVGGNQPYGGGRSAREQLKWNLPMYCQLLKNRIEGETTDPLRFIAVSIVYQEGSMTR